MEKQQSENVLQQKEKQMRQIYWWNACRRKVWNTYSESQAKRTWQ